MLKLHADQPASLDILVVEVIAYLAMPVDSLFITFIFSNYCASYRISNSFLHDENIF
jgi:hypothetical protein